MVLVDYSIEDTFTQVRLSGLCSVFIMQNIGKIRNLLISEVDGSLSRVFLTETECPQWIFSDEFRQARLVHQSAWIKWGIPYLDDVCLLLARSAGFHPYLHGDSDHHVSFAGAASHRQMFEELLVYIYTLLKNSLRNIFYFFPCGHYQVKVLGY